MMIFLYGAPGSGKSTLGSRLAADLGLPFFDLDQEIVKSQGVSIPQLFASHGEAGFRACECLALETVCQQAHGVVALGGGALLDDLVRQKVEARGPVICLDAPFDVLASRVEDAAGTRPLLAGEAPVARLQALLQQREPHYASFPHRLSTSQASVEQLSQNVQGMVGMFRLSGMQTPYDILISSGSLRSVGKEMRSRGLGGPVAVVSDTQVTPLWASFVLESLESAGYTTRLIVIPTGENHKTIETVQWIWECLIDTKLERGSTVVALGGGVVGDLTGFAAAMYLRGIRWVALPTTLLAMVDASLGGKTGVDLPQGKNLVGAFHAPTLVLSDPVVLSTLPETEFHSGLGEVVKHGVIGDPGLFAICEQGVQAVQANLVEVVRRAAAVKVHIVQSDPFEKGERASLNLGHTLGHALELETGYRLRHGEAVAIGMVAAAHISENFGLAEDGLVDRITHVVRSLGLPDRIPPGLQLDRLWQAMQVDKKRSQGKIRFVLPVRIGEVRTGVEVDLLAHPLLWSNLFT